MFENVDGRRTTDDRRRTTDAGVTGILIAHLGAFGSGEIKIHYFTFDLEFGSRTHETSPSTLYIMWPTNLQCLKLLHPMV